MTEILNDAVTYKGMVDSPGAQICSITAPNRIIGRIAVFMPRTMIAATVIVASKEQ